MTKLVFLDTETTGLDSDRHEVWEIGAIVREDVVLEVGETVTEEYEYAWQIRPTLRTADAGGLRIGRFYQRIQVVDVPGRAMAIEHPSLGSPEVMAIGADDVARELAPLLDGATIVGAVPDFDARFLTRFLREYNQAWTAHYHLVDVETLAAGALRKSPPWGFDDLLAAYKLEYDEADRHTALGDARMARDLYDAVMAAEA